MGRNVPFVVLDEPNHGQTAQIGHVQGFAHFPFCHSGIADGTKHHWRRSWTIVFEAHALAVLKAQSDSCRWYGLHARGTTLMRNSRKSLAVERRVAIVRAASAEGVISLRKQLQHELLGFQSDTEQQTIVAIVCAEKVLFL